MIVRLFGALVAASFSFWAAGDDVLLHALNNSNASSSSSPSNSSKGNVVAGFNYVITTSTHEGMSKWSYIIGDVADIVMHLERSVMIEHCLREGHIHPCYRNGAFPLSKIFDLKTVTRENPRLKMISWEEFTAQKNISNLEWVGCVVGNNLANLRSDWKLIGHTSVKNRTIHAASFHNCVEEADRMSRKDGQDRLTWISCPWIQHVHRAKKSQNPRVKLPIQQYIYDQVHRILNVSNYIAFNWRSETTSWPRKEECLPQFLHMAHQWESHRIYSKYKRILVSDISFNNSRLIWYVEGPTPQRVVTMLNTTFEKLETLRSRAELRNESPFYQDSIFDALWDKIISEEAAIFITCNSKYHKECDRCTRRESHYVNEIIKQREKTFKLCVGHWAGPDEKDALSACKSLRLLN